MPDAHLPGPVADALVAAPAGSRLTVPAAGIEWSALAWGDPSARPLLLIHGVTSSAAAWWRLGPALAAAGRRVVAMDLPGHGRTGQWRGRHRFRDTAAEVVAFAEAAGLAMGDLQVVGHSWGAMTAAALPAAGLRPATLVLLDPPALDEATMSALIADADVQTYTELEAARAAVRAANPTWSDGDVDAKAEALTELDAEAARAVLMDNGDWDGGLADLADPAAAGVEVWVVRADPDAGGYLPDAWVPAFEARVGAARFLTIEGSPHSPQRTHPIETTLAILHALHED
ncbi:MAG: alpha/beta fold hydrolase [Candidatus Limnocylindria bacterium]